MRPLTTGNAISMLPTALASPMHGPGGSVASGGAGDDVSASIPRGGARLDLGHDARESFVVHHDAAATFREIDRLERQRNVAATAVRASTLVAVPERPIEPGELEPDADAPTRASWR